jgi:hypothetical protein
MQGQANWKTLAVSPKVLFRLIPELYQLVCLKQLLRPQAWADLLLSEALQVPVPLLSIWVNLFRGATASLSGFLLSHLQCC